MNDVKAEFKSCALTGLIGLAFFASLASGVYHLSEESKKGVKSNIPAQKVTKKQSLPKKANYWTMQKDR